MWNGILSAAFGGVLLQRCCQKKVGEPQVRGEANQQPVVTAIIIFFDLLLAVHSECQRADCSDSHSLTDCWVCSLHSQRSFQLAEWLVVAGMSAWCGAVSKTILGGEVVKTFSWFAKEPNWAGFGCCFFAAPAGPGVPTGSSCELSESIQRLFFSQHLFFFQPPPLDPLGRS